MTQDELNCLILGMINDLNVITKSKDFLNIALEQLEDNDNKTNERVELLVSTYLSIAECTFDNLKSDFRKLKKHCKANLLEGDN